MVLSDWMGSGEIILGLSLGDDGVFVRTSSTVASLAKTQTSMVISTVQEVPAFPLESDRTGIANDALYIYYTSPSSGLVRRVPKTSTVAQDVAFDSGKPLAVALDATHVYWSNGAGEIRRAKKPL